MAASGSLACLKELRDRGNMVVVEVCNTCDSVLGLCAGKDDLQYCKMDLPLSSLAFSYALACMYNKSLRISKQQLTISVWSLYLYYYLVFKKREEHHCFTCKLYGYTATLSAHLKHTVVTLTLASIQLSCYTRYGERYCRGEVPSQAFVQQAKSKGKTTL